MNIIKTFAISIAVLTTSFCINLLYLNDAMAQKTGFWAGSDKINITPATPVPMSGYGSRKAPFKGVHDDIFARSLVLSDGKNKAAIISAEVIGFSHAFWEECASQISRETGIPVDHIFLTAVHNHNGPDTRVYSQNNSPEVLAYVDELREKIVKITKSANQKLTPASIGAGKGECKMNINRVAPNGKGGVTLGRNPYGPCDHEVGVLRINDQAGNPLALLVNWPCHAVVLGPRNLMISGDWPGAASAYLEDKLGNGADAFMIIGASGDINPIYGPHIDFEVTSSYAFGKDVIGEDLGKEALRVANDIVPVKNARINAMQRQIYLPLKEKATPENYQQPKSSSSDSLMVRLSALKIGDIAITAVSGEVFNQISVRMRIRSPYPNTFMVTHCNGSSGYLVTEEAYSIGGYEVSSTRAKTGAEKAIIENLLDMIEKL